MEGPVVEDGQQVCGHDRNIDANPVLGSLNPKLNLESVEKVGMRIAGAVSVTNSPVHPVRKYAVPAFVLHKTGWASEHLVETLFIVFRKGGSPGGL